MTVETTRLQFPSWIDMDRWDRHQQPVFEEICSRFDEGNRLVLADMPCGCVSGDTLLTINRGGIGRKYPIAHVVAQVNGQGTPGTGKTRTRIFHWKPDIPTRIQRQDGEAFLLGTVCRAWSSGERLTYELQTRLGFQIRATEEHPFLSANGFVPLADLSSGQQVAVNNGRPPARGDTHKLYYKQVPRLYGHPFAANRKIYRDANGQQKNQGWRVPTHRLVVEAEMNNLEMDVFIARLRDGDVEGLEFIDTATHAVHHIDGDTMNNSRSNLQVLTHREHNVLEGGIKNWKNVAIPVSWDEVVSITRFGHEETYDLQVSDDPHNYVANGFVVHNSGKSVTAEMVRQHLGVAGYYLVGTKGLQDQNERTLGLPSIKGRANYIPNGIESSGSWQDPTCSDCDYESRSDMCSFCSRPNACPYTLAKDYASTDELPCANYSYALGEWTSPRSAFRNRGLVICDESDTIPDELMGFVSIDISPRSQQRLNLRPPDKKTVESSWASWFEYAIPHVEGERATLYGRSLEVNRRRARLDKLIEKLRFVAEDLEGWVYEYDRDYISFKPVMVDKIAPKYLWAHGERFLCMTGSGGSPEQFVSDTGFDGPWAYVTAASTFPVEKRPIYVAPFARMTKKTEEVERPKLAAALLEVIDMYPDAKMLVHTVSYSLTKYLLDRYADHYWYDSDPNSPVQDRRVFAYLGGGDEKTQAIEQFERVSNAVLLAPSLDRGYDNPDIDVCVICKVPSPYLGSKQIQKRLYETQGGSRWYANLTIQTLVQMYGRVMRSENDSGITICLDSMFGVFYNKWKSWFPAHYREAVDFNSDIGWELKNRLRGR